MKETYLSRDFRETAAQCFPSQAKQLNAAFDARLNALLFLEVMNVYDGVVIDKLWVGHSRFWVLPGLEDAPFVQTWRQVLKRRSILALIWVVGAAIVGGIVVLIF